MKKIALFIPALLLMLMAATVHAHGPVRGKMTATVTIDASADKIWDVIKNYDNLSWLPPVKSVTADKGNTVGSIRVLTLQNGKMIIEELKKYDAKKMSYKYKITEMSEIKTIKHSGQDVDIPVVPVENYAAAISVKEKDGKSVVKWVATYYRAYLNNEPPEELNEAAADKAVSGILKSGLSTLLKKFDKSGSESDVSIKMKR